MDRRFWRTLTVGTVLAVLAGSVQSTAQASPRPETVKAPVKVSASMDSSLDASRVAKKWDLKLRTTAGKKLGTVKMRDGSRSPKLVIGTSVRAKGRVPAPVLKRLQSRKVTLQTQRVGSGSGSWKRARTVKVAKNGRFDVKLKITKKLLHKHRFRVAATTVRKAGGLTATTTTTSSSTTGTVVSQFIINIVNNTGDNLNIAIPTSQTTSSSGTYNYATMPLNNGDTHGTVYTNAPPAATFFMNVTKQNCVGQCTNYRTAWNYTPNKSSVACGSTSSDAPQLVSAGVYTVTLTPQFGSGYDGALSGPIYGAGTPNDTCTFQQVEAFDNWIENNPVKGFIACVIAVAVIALLIVATVSTGGADAPLEGEALWDAYEIEVAGQYDMTPSELFESDSLMSDG